MSFATRVEERPSFGAGIGLNGRPSVVRGKRESEAARICRSDFVFGKPCFDRHLTPPPCLYAFVFLELCDFVRLLRYDAFSFL